MTNVRDLWNGLGSFWEDFESKADIQTYWTGLIEVFDEVTRNTYRTNLMRSFDNSPDIWIDRYASFNIAFSGVQDTRINQTNYFPMGSGYEGVFSIPTLSGIETGQVLTEFTDYEIVDYNKIYIYDLNTLQHNTAQPLTKRVTLFANTLSRVDPITFWINRDITELQSVHPKQTAYWPYTVSGITYSGIELTASYQTEKARALKYMTWGVINLKLGSPTVKRLEWLYNILYNKPFAYEPGTFAVSGLECTVGNYTYYRTTADAWLFSGGESIERFQPLCQGISIYDNYNNSALIGSFFTIPNNALYINADPNSNSSYFTDVVTTFTENYIGKQYNTIFNIGIVTAPYVPLINYAVPTLPI